MNRSTNKQLILDYIQNVVNNRDFGDIHKYLSEDYTEVHGSLRETIGPEKAKERIKGLYNTFPDFNIEVDRQIEEGDWVVTCCSLSGTHSGVWMNMKPTGKKMKYTGVIVDKVVNGKIVEHGGAVNNFDAFLETGAIRMVKIDE